MSTSKSLQPHVNFNTGDQTEERKKRYLTAKYGQHQMNLIKKRLKVEMWMYEQLQVLYNAVSFFPNNFISFKIDSSKQQQQQEPKKPCEK